MQMLTTSAGRMGQVSDEMTAWLRGQIGQRMGLARHAIESEACVAEWTELCSGVLVTGPPSHDDTWDGTHPLGDSRLTRLMADNDPRDVIARCEAELAILGEYEAAVARDDEADADFAAWVRGEPVLALPPVRLAMGVRAGLERAVRHVARGYRHRPGYRQEWMP